MAVLAANLRAKVTARMGAGRMGHSRMGYLPRDVYTNASTPGFYFWEQTRGPAQIDPSVTWSQVGSQR